MQWPLTPTTRASIHLLTVVSKLLAYTTAVKVSKVIWQSRNTTDKNNL